MSYTIHHSEIRAWLSQFQGEPYHALLCDPPYHLTSITKRFGAVNSTPAQYGKDGAFARASRGFMGKQWDGGDIAFKPELWHELGLLLYPGAFGLAFASTRGYHRMAVAIEDAGLIIHPMLVWTFSSGFPKATQVKGAPAFKGHRYGGQVLAPSLEPIVCFQRPYDGRPLDNITQTGAGTLNIQGTRLPTDERHQKEWNRTQSGSQNLFPLKDVNLQEYQPDGRWAKNLLLVHSPDCTDEACTANCPGTRMDEQSGDVIVAPSGKPSRGNTDNSSGIKFTEDNPEVIYYGDSGGASRFYFQADYTLDRLEETDPFIYAAKASTGEREAGLQDFEALPPGALAGTHDQSMLTGSGNIRDNLRRNIHATVKPLQLAQYLATLLLPPDAYSPRRLLNPFCGSGSELIGGMLAGWDVVDGIEMESDYADIARARLAFWQEHKPNLAGKRKPKAKINKVDPRQKGLFDE